MCARRSSLFIGEYVMLKKKNNSLDSVNELLSQNIWPANEDSVEVPPTPHPTHTYTHSPPNCLI